MVELRWPLRCASLASLSLDLDYSNAYCLRTPPRITQYYYIRHARGSGPRPVLLKDDACWTRQWVSHSNKYDPLESWQSIPIWLPSTSYASSSISPSLPSPQTRTAYTAHCTDTKQWLLYKISNDTSSTRGKRKVRCCVRNTRWIHFCVRSLF